MNIIIFIASVALLAFSSAKLVDSLIGIARYLRWREFVVGFLVMAIATSTPNLFVGINAALHGIPELSFG
ncbi:MAG: sodium:calcium antiporter, partial [bacterium]|nr:sodium:calcium antiporter [bacterium]